jgi:multisubunit Na+/H+ antiporter MnhG subunit
VHIYFSARRLHEPKAEPTGATANGAKPPWLILNVWQRTMIFLGLFFIAFGAFTLFQARLPREKRKIYARSNGWPWRKKDRKPSGRYSCISFGVSFSAAGILLSLAALNIAQIDDVYIPIVSILLFVIMIAGVTVDGLKKEPNQQASQPTAPSGRGSC